MKKLALCTIVGLLTWTLSIQVIPLHQNAAARTQSAAAQTKTDCPEDDTTAAVFQGMLDGVVTQVFNDGTTLAVEFSDAWNSLSRTAKTRLHDSLSCLADADNLTLAVQTEADDSEKKLAKILTEYREALLDLAEYASR